MQTPGKKEKTFLIMKETDISQAETLFQKYIALKSLKDNGNESSIWSYIKDVYGEDYPLKGSSFGAVIISEIQRAFCTWQDTPIFDKNSLINFSCTDDPLAELLFLQEALKEGAYDQHGNAHNINICMYNVLYRLKRYNDALIFVKKALTNSVKKTNHLQQNNEWFGYNDILIDNIFCLSRARRNKEVIKAIKQYLYRDRIHSVYSKSEAIDVLKHIYGQTQKILKN